MKSKIWLLLVSRPILKTSRPKQKGPGTVGPHVEPPLNLATSINWQRWIQLYLENRNYIYQPVACIAIVIQHASLNFYLLIFSKSSKLEGDNLPSGGSTRGPTGASAPVKLSLAPAVAPPELTE